MQAQFNVEYTGGEPGKAFHPEALDRALLSVRDFVLKSMEESWDGSGVPPTVLVMTVDLEFH